MKNPAHFLDCIMLVLVAGLTGCTAPPADNDDLGAVGNFSLTERSGNTVTQADLQGKVWVASFIFTRCAGPCTRVSGCMAHLQKELENQPDCRLVSITVDPEYDQPAVLRDYAGRFSADPERWLFLTGKPQEVNALIRNGFHLTAQQNEGSARTPGNEVMHDTRLAIIDRHGHIRDYVQATDPDAVDRVKKKIIALLRETP
jgi:cytochrome oxidase Cu insertion factor (SCO1/SenC/PrrC family)